MKIKRYYILEHKGRTVDITRDMLTLGPMPVLWCNAGMYAIIPGAILEDIFEVQKTDNLICTIWWEQGYEIPPEIGRLLCDSTYNRE